MKKVKLIINGVADTLTSTTAHFTVVLQEEGGRRKLPIVIGQFEAQAILIEIENLTPMRPLTHDLFKSVASEFNIELREVVIYKLKEGIYYAKLLCMLGDVQKEIDCRTSDALALALRFNCPIYAYESVISSAGVETDAEKQEQGIQPVENPGEESTGSKVRSTGKIDYSSLSEDQLKESLAQAINDEAYEKASIIRDELHKRQQK